MVRPNADTLYSVMFFDVSKDPMVFSVPDSGGRYYLLPMLDMWSDVFAVPGKRTTGTGAQTFAVVGPHWQGQLPKGVEAIRSPTSTVFMLGRTQTNGKADYAAVHKFQDGLKAVPLSHYGKPYTPPKGTVNAALDMSSPSDQVHKMDAATFFATFAELLKTNPPHANDYPILARLKRIGIEPGKSFSLASASPEVQRALTRRRAGRAAGHRGGSPEVGRAGQRLAHQPDRHRHLRHRLPAPRRHRLRRPRRQHRSRMPSIRACLPTPTASRSAPTAATSCISARTRSRPCAPSGR